MRSGTPSKPGVNPESWPKKITAGQRSAAPPPGKTWVALEITAQGNPTVEPQKLPAAGWARTPSAVRDKLVLATERAMRLPLRSGHLDNGS